jgi:MATE family multidrug resistance protein
MKTESMSTPALPWIEKPLPELLRLTWPIAVSMLSYSVMTLVDTLFVGHLGKDELAGVGLAGTMAFALCCFSIGLLRGVKIMVSQGVGAGQDETEQRSYLGAGMLLAAACGVFTLIIGLLAAPFTANILTGTASGVHATEYMRIRMLGTPFVLFYITLREVRYGQGDSYSPMIATLIANVINIALDYMLIYYFEWGVIGAAWATFTCQGFEMILLCKGQTKDFFGLQHTKTRHTLAIWRVGLPTGLQFAVEIGSFALLAIMVAAMSDEQMAAHQIALQVVHFSFLPAFAISEAVSVMTGQAVGANRDDLVKPVSYLGLWVACAFTAIFTIVFSTCAHWIASKFTTTEDEVTRIATELLYVASIFQIADGANMVARGALRGTGDVRIPALIGIVTAWMMTPPLTWLLGYRAGLGALGGWIGLCAEILLGVFLLWWRLLRDHWHDSARFSRCQMKTQDGSLSSCHRSEQ